MFLIEQPIPPAPAADSEANVLAEWNAIYDAYNEELKSMFEKQAGVERFNLIETFHACKHKEGKPVGAYVLKMKDYVEELERLSYVLPQDLSVGLILNGLTSDFTDFVRNYNFITWGRQLVNYMLCSLSMKKVYLKRLKPQVMMIKGGKIQKANKKSLKAKGKGKANGKGKDKQGYIPKPKNPKPTAKEHPTKDDTCHHCKEVGHWKRNCLVFLAELLKKKKQVGTTSSSGIFTIELFDFPNKSWMYDNGYGTHICITKQGFREARKLKQGALYLYVGNGGLAQVEAIGSFDLVLPNGLVICLDNFHYAPSITRGVVSVHRLIENRFVQCFTDFGISVSKNNVYYFNDIPSNSIYEIDMHDLIPNNNSIVSTKRAKPKRYLDSTLSVALCLAYISNRLWLCLSLKHKHEVFETFKVFKNEVENQLGKTIKALRSDRGGEYISQEFKDYLKAFRIVQQLTSPYTPQHNGVSERRNESATRILNMVPTKKVDKTPYELWYGKVPNLSYLKVWGCETLVKRDTPNKLQQKSVNGRAVVLEEIQDEDTPPSKITSEIPMEVEGFEPPQEEIVVVAVGGGFGGGFYQDSKPSQRVRVIRMEKYVNMFILQVAYCIMYVVSDAYTYPPLPRVPLSYQASACSLSTLHFLKFSENSFEVLKLLENSVEVLRSGDKLESMKIWRIN
ncbi:NIN-like protein [Tanacetum coccineum]